MGEEVDYVSNILKQLTERNKKYDKFKEVVNSHAALFESRSALKNENKNLTEQCALLKQQNHDLQVKLEAGDTSNGGVRSEKYAALEQKLYRTQEELTELHRNKGANAQQIINLNLALQETEKERNKLEEHLAQRDKEIESLTTSMSKLEQTVNDFKQANDTLNDEYKALHLAYESIEGKLRQLQSDNAELVERSLVLQREKAERELLEKKAAAVPEPVTNNSDEQINDQALSQPPRPIKKFLDFFGGTSKKSASPHTYREPVLSMFRSASVIVQVPKSPKIKWRAHDGEVSAVRYSPSSELLATGGTDKLIKLWCVSEGHATATHTFRGCNGGINNIDYDPTEQILISCSNDYATRIWTLATQRERLTLTGHSGKVLSVRYLAYSAKVVTGSQDRTVKIWDVKSGSCVKTYMPGSSCNDLVAVDPSGECIASGHFDRKVRLYDTRASTSQAMYEIELDGRITSLDMPAEKDVLLCCTKNHKLSLINMKSRSIVSTFVDDNFRVATDHTRCAFSTDGEYVSVGSADGSVLAWNVQTNKLASHVQSHTSPVISCSWSGELVTGDKQGQCILWTDC